MCNTTRFICYTFCFFTNLLLLVIFFQINVFVLLSRVEHPAAGFKKIFETVEELNEPIPAEIKGKEESGLSTFLWHFCLKRKSRKKDSKTCSRIASKKAD